MSEEKTPNALAKIREWVSAHPIISGVIAGSAVVIAAQMITARAANAELSPSDAAPLEIDGDVVE